MVKLCDFGFARLLSKYKLLLNYQLTKQKHPNLLFMTEKLIFNSKHGSVQLRFSQSLMA